MSNPALKPGWQIVEFGDVVKNTNLVERNPKEAGIDRVVGLEHIDPERLHINRWDSLGDTTSFSRKFVPGQTLFGKRRAYQRKVAYAEFEGLCSGDILTFEPINQEVLLSGLLPFICQTESFYSYAIGTSAGSLSPRTSWAALKKYPVLLPPIDEQHSVLEILQAVSVAIESYRTLIENIKSAQIVYFESMSQEDTNFQSTLGRSLDGIIAGKSPLGASRPAADNEYGVLKVSAIGSSGYVESENKVLLNQEDFSPDYEVKPGFILVTRANARTSGVGRPCIVTNTRQGLMLSDKTLRLAPNLNCVLERFLLQNLFGKSYRKYIERAAGGTEAKNISQTQLRNAPIWLPPLDVQKNIVETLMAFDRAIHEANTHIFDCLSLLKELRSRLEGVGNV